MIKYYKIKLGFITCVRVFFKVERENGSRVMNGLLSFSLLYRTNRQYFQLDNKGPSTIQLYPLSSQKNQTAKPGSLSQLSYLHRLDASDCKKLEVLPELPHSIKFLDASDCTIDNEGSTSKTQCLDSSITSQSSIHQLSGFLGYLVTSRCEFFLQDTGYYYLDIVYHGNSMPEWFTNRSRGNHVKVELPSDWCYDKFKGYGTCVVFKCKKPHKLKGYYLKNFDGASLDPRGYISPEIKNYFEKEAIGIQDSYMIWLHYTRYTHGWEEVKNFVTFSFEENNEEDVEVKECGLRLICDGGDLQQQDVTNWSMLLDLPTLSHGGAMRYSGRSGLINWSW